MLLRKLSHHKLIVAFAAKLKQDCKHFPEAGLEGVPRLCMRQRPLQHFEVPDRVDEETAVNPVDVTVAQASILWSIRN